MNEAKLKAYAEYTQTHKVKCEKKTTTKCKQRGNKLTQQHTKYQIREEIA